MTVTQDASHPHARRFSADEQRRLAAMRRYEIVDSPRDSTFGSMIASLAGRIIDAPMATVPIVVSDRLSFKPAHGLKNIGVTSRNQGRSASAVVHWEPYSVSSNRTDLRAAAYPPAPPAALLVLFIPPDSTPSPAQENQVTDRTLSTTRQSHAAGATVVAVTGELDLHTATELTQAIDETPFNSEAHVVLDLTGLTYCDSTGITVLISAYNRAQKTGARLVLVGLSADLMRVFHIVGLDQLFVCQPTVEDAINALHP